jgi:hypothetical protein
MGDCICGSCPSYLDCSKKAKGKKELGFCFETVGKSKCIKDQKGCICGACPVKQQRGFKNFYFCIKGSEDQQNKK